MDVPLYIWVMIDISSFRYSVLILQVIMPLGKLWQMDKRKKVTITIYQRTI